MSSRPQLSPEQIITDGDMSDDIVSEVTIIQKISLVSYSFSWSGSSPVGVITIEVSNDFSLNGDGSVRNEGTWSALDIDPAGAVSGSSGTGFVNISDISAYAIRAVYTSTSGTGTIQGYITGKVA